MSQLSTLDWSWIVGFLLVAFLLALYHSRKASRSVQDYFVAGRNTPWWILGTSIVATSFAADTPLAVSRIVITEGISGNWFWWAVLPSGMLGVFFFAHLWRRSGCLTQAEFAALRYQPGRARTLRIVNVVFQGLIQNCITLGWVNLAMVKIIESCTTLQTYEALGFCFALTVIYTLLGGISGVMWTDFLQFFLALGSSFLVAYYCVTGAGGLDAVVDAVRGKAQAAGAGDAVPDLLAYLPEWGTTAAWACAIYTTLFWIACTPTDCNGYAVQRLLAARNARHAVWGYLWYNFAHYVLRPWPWILMGLVAVASFDYGAGAGGRDPEKAYIEVLLAGSPRWLVGPALASLLAAYMSTIDTHLNWGASYVINDLYMPYLKPGRSPAHYVWASRVATAGVALCGIGVTLGMGSIVGGWGLFFALLSGMGIVRIARWLWWRVTAWTEIGCMAAAGLSTCVMSYGFPEVEYPFNLLFVVPVSMCGAALGTFAVRPEPRAVLQAFVRQVQPPGPGWRRLRTAPAAGSSATSRGGSAGPDLQADSGPVAGGLLRPLVCWVLSTAAVYAAMFGVGDWLLRSRGRGLAMCGAAVLLAVAAGFIHTARHRSGGAGTPERPANEVPP